MVPGERWRERGFGTADGDGNPDRYADADEHANGDADADHHPHADLDTDPHPDTTSAHADANTAAARVLITEPGAGL